MATGAPQIARQIDGLVVDMFARYPRRKIDK
jgi:hypothetical protein